MNDELKKQIYNSLRENGLIKIWREQLHETEEVTCDSPSINNNDIATSSDGTQYIKSLVIKYLNEKGYPLTQDNIDLAAKMFQANGGTDIAKLNDILNKRSQSGWKLVNTFTNELGINSHVEQHTFSNNVHVNSTIDQIVMIFERPMSMTDKKAQEIISQMQNS